MTTRSHVLLRTGFLVCAVASMATTAMGQRDLGAGMSAGPTIDSISPDSVIEKPVPQPTITITGSNLRQPGVFDASGNPTITITHAEDPSASFSAVAGTNFSGTQATISPGLNTFNLLQAPLGVYDLTLTRPDGQSVTVSGAFSINTQPEPTPGAIEMRVASYWGGPILGMDPSPDGQTAYIANGRVLRILNIEDESNPTSIGSIFLNGVYDVKVRDGYAFVAAQSPYSFCVVDVSDPTSPELVWSAHSPHAQRQVELYGDYAIVSRLSGSGSMSVFDISDPLNVVSMGTIGSADGFTIDGDRLVTNQGIFDLAADPVNPPLISSFSGIDSSGSSIAVSRKHVYIAGDGIGGTLRTIDVSDLASPVIVDVKDGFYNAASVSVSDGYLYLVDARSGPGGSPSLTKGMLIYDIGTDPASPALLAEYRPHSVPKFDGVNVSGERAYLTCDGEGLLILDIANPAQPLRLGNYHSPSRLTRMAKRGEHLFVLDPWGVTILDVSNPSHAQVVSYFVLDSKNGVTVTGMDLALQDELLYISSRHMGLNVVDLSDLANPTLVGNFFPPPPNFMNQSYFVGLAVAGNIAQIGFHDQINPSFYSTEHLIVDISEPGGIFEVGRSGHVGAHANPANAIVLHESAEAAYTTHGSGGTHKIDVSDVANPLHINMIPMGLNDTSLALAGDTLFAAASPTAFGSPGLHILDASKPLPESMAYINSDVARAVDVQNDRAYVLGLGNGVTLLDVSDPTSPAELDSLGGIHGTAVLVDEPQVFITSVTVSLTNAGLVIVDVLGVEPQGLLGDLNNDGVVNVGDLLILLSAWGQCPRSGNCTADLNGDGVVNVGDMLLLLSNWG